MSVLYNSEEPEGMLAMYKNANLVVLCAIAGGAVVIVDQHSDNNFECMWITCIESALKDSCFCALHTMLYFEETKSVLPPIDKLDNSTIEKALKWTLKSAGV